MRGFLKRFRSGMPVSQVVDTENLNRIANILEDIEGYNGIRIEKPTNAKGCGWKVVLDLTGGAVGDSGFPFGEQWPFGLKIDGAEVTIYGGIYRFASKEINVAAADPITITADGQWIASVSYTHLTLPTIYSV